jgi:bifunctional non-homologous end joining protein LigD
MVASSRSAWPAKMPVLIEACLATLVDAAPSGARWLHEIKWDGYRLIAHLAHGKAVLRTRREHDWTARFPTIAALIKQSGSFGGLSDGLASSDTAAGHGDHCCLILRLDSLASPPRGLTFFTSSAKPGS